MYRDKKPSAEDTLPEEAKFEEELKKRLSILQYQEDVANPPDIIDESGDQNDEASKAIRKEPSIFRPLQKFIPSSVDLLSEEMLPRKPSRASVYLSLLIFSSLIFGLLVGWLMKFRRKSYTERDIFYIQLPGHLFERSVEILLIPYISSSIISNVGRLPTIAFLKMLSKITTYSTLTTLCASFIGLVMSFALPSSSIKVKLDPQPQFSVIFGIVEVFLDMLLNILPSNIVYACLTTEHIHIRENSNVTGLIRGSYEIFLIQRTNFLGIVMFCILVGMALHQIGASAEWFFCLTDVLTNLMTLIGTWLLWASPIAFFFLILGEIVGQELEGQTLKLVRFSGLFLLGLIIHHLLILPLIFYVITFNNPFRYIYKCSLGLLAGFATCKSYSALPFVIKCLRKSKINLMLLNAMLPILATINKNGNALLCAFISSYLMRQTDLGLSIPKGLQILFFSTFSSNDLGLNFVKFENILLLSEYLGLKQDMVKREIGLFLAVGWFLDRLRVCANLLGHIIGIKILQRISNKELNTLKIEEQVVCNTLFASSQKTNKLSTIGLNKG